MLLNQSEPGSARPTCPWPAKRTERSAIERLIPYADGTRLCSEADTGNLADPLRQWGTTNPVRTGRHQASGQSFNEDDARQNHALSGTGHGASSLCCQ
jgi:hypothetical protein